MSKPDDFLSPEDPTWCPACGDYSVLRSLKEAMGVLGLKPHEVMIVSGIGCGSKVPYYFHANGYDSLHGRPVPVAQGIKLANHALKVIVISGDGDSLGIGGNHFLHVMRRNPDITQIIEDNQIYGLTKGQYSPTSAKGTVTTTSPDGSLETALNPMVMGVAGGATFVSRTFAGNPKHMTDIFVKAVRHKGYSLVDVLQPCVTFNKVNTYQWYKQRVYEVDQSPGYKPQDKRWAFDKALEWGDKIPIGLLYEEADAPTYEEQVPALAGDPLVEQDKGFLNRRVLADEKKLKEAFC
ncbi:MAG: 2-oxoacid:ferredoxin oxidoreductase subunit beta [Candidatus Omnitrophica bacterium]|nr:2-oxoacid:ferredoxin oxidoreductase subunit beta [Candidatus Omnitrophota bacterium]